MAKIITTNCDGCDKVLWGKYKAAYVQEPHIQINGQIVEQCIDPDTHCHFHTFITPTPTERLSFCDLTCLDTYIQARKLLWEQKKDRIRHEEASTDRIDELANDGIKTRKTFVD